MTVTVPFPCWEHLPLAANDRNDRRSGGYRKFNDERTGTPTVPTTPERTTT